MAKKGKAKQGHQAPKRVSSPAKKKHKDKVKKSGGPTSVGRTIGGFIGDNAERLFSKITGMGSYKVNKNTLLDSTPVFSTQNGMDGSLEFRHKEYLGDIVSGASADFNAEHWVINPGDVDTFPFLARIAENFEQYDIKGLVFEYKSTSATSITTTINLGTVMLATEYDVTVDPFTSKIGMDSTLFSTTSKVYESMLHPVECAPKQTVLGGMYIRRTDSDQTGTDPRFMDMGRLTVATQGCPVNQTLGELWISYHVRLLKPRLDEIPTDSPDFGKYRESPQSSATQGNPFGSTATFRTPQPHSSPGVAELYRVGTSEIEIDRVGDYFVSILWVTETGTNITEPLVDYSHNCEGILVLNHDGFSQKAVMTGTLASLQFFVRVTGAHAQLDVVGPQGMATGSCDLMIAKCEAVAPEFLSPNERIKQLETQFANLLRRREGSETDEEWFKKDYSTSSKQRFKPNLDKTLIEAGVVVANSPSVSSNRLSDSVVNLIAEKLRK
jgi:hypothetical protein